MNENRRPGKFWAYAAALTGAPLLLAGLSAALGYLAVPLLAGPTDALVGQLGVMGVIFLGLGSGSMALFHGLGSLGGRPSGPMRWPGAHFFWLIFALALGLGLVLVNFGVADQLLFPPVFLLGAALPTLSVIAWSARRLGWPLTWRQGMLALAAGSTLSVLVAIVLEGILGIVSYVLMFSVRVGLFAPGEDVASRLFFSPALVIFLIATAIQAPIPEEFAKALSSTFFGRQRIANERQAFALGLVAGAGFAILENMLYEGFYAPQAGWSWGAVTALRGLGAPLHPIGTALVTLGWFRSREKGWGELLKAYGVAVGLHTLWNGGFSAFVYVTGLEHYSQSATVTLYGRPIQIVLVAVLVALALLLWWLLRRLVTGLSSGAEPDVAPAIVSRRALAAWALAAALVAMPLGAMLGPAREPIQSVVAAGLPTATPTATRTPTRAATATRTPAPGTSRTPTPAPIPPGSATPNLTATQQVQAAARAQWRVTFSDDFGAAGSGWPTGDDNGAPIRTSRSIAGGKYRWQSQTNQGGVSAAVPIAASVSDCDVSVQGQRISGARDASFGLVLRFVDADNYYLFRITDDGYFVFQAQYKGELRNTGAWAKSSAIRPGEVNRLAVSADGPRFAFSINGQKVGEAYNDQLPSGRVGLAVGILGSGADEATVEFDDFEVRSP